MIKKGAKLEVIRVPLEELRVFEHQVRYPDRVLHYLNLLAQNDVDDLGVIHIKKRDYGYEILDGHHRYVSLVLSGRKDALCLLIDESHLERMDNVTGTDAQHPQKKIRPKLGRTRREDVRCPGCSNLHASAE